MTTGRQVVPLRDRRFAVWIATTAALFLIAATVGFVWLPAVQAGRSVPDLWGAICSAIGLPTRDAAASSKPESKPASDVAWTEATRQSLSRGDAAREMMQAATMVLAAGGFAVKVETAGVAHSARD